MLIQTQWEMKDQQPGFLTKKKHFHVAYHTLKMNCIVFAPGLNGCSLINLHLGLVSFRGSCTYCSQLLSLVCLILVSLVLIVTRDIPGLLTKLSSCLFPLFPLSPFSVSLVSLVVMASAGFYSSTGFVMRARPLGRVTPNSSMYVPLLLLQFSFRVFRVFLNGRSFIIVI